MSKEREIIHLIFHFIALFEGLMCFVDSFLKNVLHFPPDSDDCFIFVLFPIDLNRHSIYCNISNSFQN